VVDDAALDSADTGPAARRRGPVVRIAAFLALLFTFLIVGHYAASFLPREPLGWASWIVTAASALTAGWIVISHLDGRPLGALGFALVPRSGAEAGWGMLLGGALIAVATALLLLSGTAGFRPDAGGAAEYVGHLLVTLAFFWVAAAAEELLFRGYAFQALVEALGVWPTVIGTSVLFSWMHGGNPGVDAVAFVNIFLAGVMLALAYLRTRSLWFATAVHAGWNWTMASLLDFPVSGLTAFDTPMYDAVELGADWWTGGAFGPEAGLAGSIALLAGALWLMRTRRLAESEPLRAMRPLVDARRARIEPSSH
jgi:membrane protease YdiL (CAAX protease family)